MLEDNRGNDFEKLRNTTKIIDGVALNLKFVLNLNYSEIDCPKR